MSVGYLESLFRLVRSVKKRPGVEKQVLHFEEDCPLWSRSLYPTDPSGASREAADARHTPLASQPQCSQDYEADYPGWD